MPNKYIYDHTFEDKHEEEDRACRNDLMRVKIDYYNMLYLIHARYYDVLCDMSDDEVKRSIINKGIITRL